MKLGLSLGYWSAGPPPGMGELVSLANDLGFDSMWTSEAYGSDVLTPLTWYGATAPNLKLGTAIAQMSARSPVATAMAAMTLDHLSGGRVMLGLGASGPQVVEGWYGQPYPKPLARTREYIAIMRQTIERQKVSFDGEFFQIPFQGGTGLGKSLRSTIHPLRTDIPILLAAEGPKNVALAAEVADGWIPMFYAPTDDANYREALNVGFSREGARNTIDNFEIACPVMVQVDDDINAAADRVRPWLALYIGGMGAKGANFHKAVFDRMGYEEQCDKIQDLYLAGRKDEAIAAVTLEMIELVALVGPKAKIAEDMEAWRNSLVTTMIIQGSPDTLRLMKELTS
jgi:F420-dependent oxidoreductase-like protein